MPHPYAIKLGLSLPLQMSPELVPSFLSWGTVSVWAFIISCLDTADTRALLSPLSSLSSPLFLVGILPEECTWWGCTPAYIQPPGPHCLRGPAGLQKDQCGRGPYLSGSQLTALVWPPIFSLSVHPARLPPCISHQSWPLCRWPHHFLCPRGPLSLPSSFSFSQTQLSHHFLCEACPGVPDAVSCCFPLFPETFTCTSIVVLSLCSNALVT